MWSTARFTPRRTLVLVTMAMLVTGVGSLLAQETGGGPRSGLHTTVGVAFPFGTGQPLGSGVALGVGSFDAIPFLPFLATDLELSGTAYAVPPGTLVDVFSGNVIGTINAGAGLVGRFDLGSRLRLTLGGSVGGAFAMPTALVSSPLTWYWAGTAGLGLKLSDSFAFTLDARYTSVAGFAQVVSAGLGIETSWPVGAGQKAVDASAPARPKTEAGPRATAERAARRGGMRPLPFTDSAPLALLDGGDIPALTARTKADPARWLQRLTEELVRAAGDDFQKVRALHDWVAMNVAYDADAFYGKSPTITDPLAVISHGASVCQGYSEVFQLMCRYAGFECVVVSGFGRGLGFDPMEDVSGSFDSNHAWNAVRIGDTWYLVDCTWDSGNVNPATQKFQRAYGTRYLFASPLGFLHTHYPEREEWQLIDAPLSFKQFCALPELRGAFFQAGLTEGPEVLLVNRVADRFGFTLQVPETTDVAVFVEAAETTGDGESRRAYSHREAGRVRFEATFPAPGSYRLSVCVVTPDEEPGTRVYSQVGELRVVASEGTPLVYPMVDPDAVRAGIAFKGEMPYDPRVSSAVTLSFAAPPDARIAASVRAGSGAATTYPPRRAIVLREGDRLAVRASFPQAGDYRIVISLVTKEGERFRWHTVAEFPVTAGAGTTRAFPETYSTYQEGWSLVAPLESPLATGAQVPIEIEPPVGSAIPDGDVRAIVNNKWITLKRGDDGRFRATVKAEGAKLSLVVRSGEKSYAGIVDWEIRERAD
ncbi:MAG TPA: transglutaminase domain-containing protein [Spirochaetia bacterium]